MRNTLNRRDRRERMLGRPHETSRSQERRCVRMGGMCTAGVCDKNRYSDSHESPTCHVALGSANRLRSLRVRKNFEACLSFEVSFEVLSINTAVVETFEVSTHALYFRPWLENTTVSHCRNGCEERVRTMLGGGVLHFAPWVPPGRRSATRAMHLSAWLGAGRSAKLRAVVRS